MTEPTDREVLDRLVRIETLLQQLIAQRDDHETRIRHQEQHALTEERVAAIARGQADQRQRRLLAWLGLAVAVISSVLGAAVGAVLAAILG